MVTQSIKFNDRRLHDSISTQFLFNTWKIHNYFKTGRNINNRGVWKRVANCISTPNERISPVLKFKAPWRGDIPYAISGETFSSLFLMYQAMILLVPDLCGAFYLHTGARVRPSRYSTLLSTPPTPLDYRIMQGRTLNAAKHVGSYATCFIRWPLELFTPESDFYLFFPRFSSLLNHYSIYTDSKGY